MANIFNSSLKYHILVFALFFCLYYLLYLENKDEHFIYKDKFDGFYDILYYTTSTHSTSGSVDPIAKSRKAKMITSIHQLLIITLIAIHLIS